MVKRKPYRNPHESREYQEKKWVPVVWAAMIATFFFFQWVKINWGFDFLSLFR